MNKAIKFFEFEHGIIAAETREQAKEYEVELCGCASDEPVELADWDMTIEGITLRQCAVEITELPSLVAVVEDY